MIKTRTNLLIIEPEVTATPKYSKILTEVRLIQNHQKQIIKFNLILRKKSREKLIIIIIFIKRSSIIKNQRINQIYCRIRILLQ